MTTPICGGSSAICERWPDPGRAMRIFASQLIAPLRPQPARRRAPVRFALGSAATAAAAVAIALVLLVDSAGPGEPATADAAILHRAAEAATPPPNAILHTAVVGVQNGVTGMAESWVQTSPPSASRGMKGDAGHHGEFGEDGRTSFEYDPSTNTIYEQPDSSAPTFADPVAQVRQELASGRAQVAGTTVIGDVALYKVDLAHGLVGYFDQTDYRARASSRGPPRGQASSGTRLSRPPPIPA